MLGRPSARPPVSFFLGKITREGGLAAWRLRIFWFRTYKAVERSVSPASEAAGIKIVKVDGAAQRSH